MLNGKYHTLILLHTPIQRQKKHWISYQSLLWFPFLLDWSETRNKSLSKYSRKEEITISEYGNTQQDFWVGITNYDLEFPPLPADDRATPMTDNVNALGGKDFDEDDVWDVLQTWPTMNMHTDIGAVMQVQDGTYDVLVYFDHGRNPI